MADTPVGWEHLQRFERLLRPTQERVALPIAFELKFGIAGECVRRAREVGDDRMVDDEVDGNARLDGCAVTSEPRHRVTYGREVGDRGDAGKVLHQHTRGHELQLAVAGLLAGTTAIRDGVDVVGAHVDTVFAS